MKPEKKQETSVLYIQLIPAHIKSYFKAYCAKREKTMNDIILDFMRSVVLAEQNGQKLKILNVQYNRRKKPIRTGTIYIRPIPIKLKNDFVDFCKKHNKTMTELIINFMWKTVSSAQEADQDE